MPRASQNANKISKRLSWRQRFGFVVLGGILGLSQAPFSQPFLLFLVLPFLAWLVASTVDWRSAFGKMWFVGIGYFAVVLNWIVEPFLVEPEIFGWMAPFALLAMSAGLALFWAGAGAICVRFSDSYHSRVVLLAVVWSAMEFARSMIFTGFPWGLLAYAWIDTPIAQAASVVGPHGLGLATLLVLFLPALFPRDVWRGGVLVLGICVMVGGWGYIRESQTTELHPRGTIVRLVQPNAEQKLKWDPKMMPVFFQRQLGYSSARSGVPVDVVIWPETSLPFFLGEDGPRLQSVADAAGKSAEVIAGGLRRDERSVFNSLVHLDQNGGVLSLYDKHHLVPFGEYVPFGDVLERFGLRGIADMVGGFAEGSGPRVLNSLNLPPYLPMICYEAIFPSYANARSIRPDWIIHLTNDAWFGSFSGPYQHLVQARMRAIEQGLPVARTANTGVSAMIDPLGQVAASIPLNEANFLDVALPAPLSPTLYSRLGDIPFLGFVVFLGLVCLLRVTPPEN